MKGIILAGGSGTRLHPLTEVTSKQLLPVFDKPMIYYPIHTLTQLYICEILIITTEETAGQFKALLGDGSKFGCVFEYATQKEPKGIAEAFLIGEKFIGDDAVALILGDNIFHLNDHTLEILNEVSYSYCEHGECAVTIGKKVLDPTAYGVVIDVPGFTGLREIIEKPTLDQIEGKNPLAIPGLYMYGKGVVEIAKSIEPSDRGELEITSINNEYLKDYAMNVVDVGHDAWFDAGTHQSLLEASNYIAALQSREGKILDPRIR